jgi:hypothetical protein
MIDSNVIMRRAVRYVCDENNLQPSSLKLFDTYTKTKFEDFAISVADDMQYNQLKYFRPFDHQLKFFATGTSPRRGILAANRIGKTVSTCYETAYHLTGLYPSWWPKNAKRFNKPITVFVAGEGWEQVARVLQDELIGTKDVKIKDHIGTGAIPKDCIVQETMRCDGANILGVEIKHASGQNSYLLLVTTHRKCVTCKVSNWTFAYLTSNHQTLCSQNWSHVLPQHKDKCCAHSRHSKDSTA